MKMTPAVRNIGLCAHIAASVGWFGAVLAFLALAIAGITSSDALVARGAYLAMSVTAWFVIVPLACAALLSGIVQSLGTAWGLFRHYWVVTKLGLTALATVVLLLKLKLITTLASAAATAPLVRIDLLNPRIELIAHAAGGLLVLFAALVVAVYKPWGTLEAS